MIAPPSGFKIAPAEYRISGDDLVLDTATNQWKEPTVKQWLQTGSATGLVHCMPENATGGTNCVSVRHTLAITREGGFLEVPVFKPEKPIRAKRAYNHKPKPTVEEVK